MKKTSAGAIIRPVSENDWKTTNKTDATLHKLW